MSHCCLDNPLKSYKLNGLDKILTIIHWVNAITLIIIQNTKLLNIPLNILISSLTFLQLKQLKSWNSTKTLKIKVKCRELTLYFSYDIKNEFEWNKGLSNPLIIVPYTWPLWYLAHKLVPIIISNSSGYYGKNYWPLSSRNEIINIWKTDWPMICFNIVLSIKLSSLFVGLSFNNYSAFGG